MSPTATQLTTTPLSRVQTGRVYQPHFILIYGVDGVGKTKFANDAPAPIFLGPEAGWGNQNVTRFPQCREYAEVLAAIQDLTTGKHDFQTLAIDTLDWIEPLLHADVCRKNGWKNIEDPGYGKGYVAANDEWMNMIRLLMKLRTRMNVICIAHCAIKTFTDPQANAQYDRYQLKLAGSGAKTDASALWREAVDTVLFANFEVSTTTEKNQRKAKAFGDGQRVIYTERRPAFDAKNRFGLPFELPLSWQAYADACTAKDEVTPAQLAQLADLTKDCTKEAVFFCIEKGLLKSGDGLKDLSAKTITRILNNPPAFFDAIKASQPTPEQPAP